MKFADKQSCMFNGKSRYEALIRYALFALLVVPFAVKFLLRNKILN